MIESLKNCINQWPRLNEENHKQTSKKTSRYNCAAFAAYDEDNVWWPRKGYYWPFPIDSVSEVDNFLRYFQSKQYKICSSSEYEKGYEKVAIYVSSSRSVLHVARQDSASPILGWWSSKMGSLEDIAHEKLSDLEGDCYGTVRYIMKRKALR